jgi:RNA polymerase sigma-70 factor (ECF subfamily)
MMLRSAGGCKAAWAAAAGGSTNPGQLGKVLRLRPQRVSLNPIQDRQVAQDGKPHSDSDIIASVRSGDKEAYRGIIDRYKRRAYHIAVGLVGEPQDALDISQMAFIKAYRNLKLFDATRPFFSWFYRILRNLCLDHLKHSSHSREVPLEDMDALSRESAAGTDSGETETRKVIWRAIETLPLEQREVIILHYFEGFSYKEIAEALGKPVGTVMSSLYYARQKLKAQLSGVLGFPASRGV